MSSSSDFSFYLTFSASMNLGDTVIYSGLEGVLLCRQCVSSVFGVKAGFGMDAGHIFPQSVLTIFPLIEDMVGVVISRACDGHEAALPLSVTALSRWSLLPSFWRRSPESWV